MVNKLTASLCTFALVLVRGIDGQINWGSPQPEDWTLTYPTSAYGTGKAGSLAFCVAWRQKCIDTVGPLNFHHALGCQINSESNTLKTICSAIPKNPDGSYSKQSPVDFTSMITGKMGVTVVAEPAKPLPPYSPSTDYFSFWSTMPAATTTIAEGGDDSDASSSPVTSDTPTDHARSSSEPFSSDEIVSSTSVVDSEIAVSTVNVLTTAAQVTPSAMSFANAASSGFGQFGAVSSTSFDATSSAGLEMQAPLITIIISGLAWMAL